MPWVPASADNVPRRGQKIRFQSEWGYGRYVVTRVRQRPDGCWSVYGAMESGDEEFWGLRSDVNKWRPSITDDWAKSIMEVYE